MSEMEQENNTTKSSLANKGLEVVEQYFTLVIPILRKCLASVRKLLDLFLYPS